MVKQFPFPFHHLVDFEQRRRRDSRLRVEKTHRGGVWRYQGVLRDRFEHLPRAHGLEKEGVARFPRAHRLGTHPETVFHHATRERTAARDGTPVHVFQFQDPHAFLEPC